MNSVIKTYIYNGIEESCARKCITDKCSLEEKIDFLCSIIKEHSCKNACNSLQVDKETETCILVMKCRVQHKDKVTFAKDALRELL